MRTKILFICTANRDRSPTAEAVYQWRPQLEVKSAGTSPYTKHTPLTAELIAWADVLVVMEEAHEIYLHEHFPHSVTKPVYCLHIPDNYRSMSAELIQIIEARMSPLIASFNSGQPSSGD